MGQYMKKFSEFAEERAVLDGPKMRIDDVMNREIVVTGSRIKESKFGKNKSGKCLTLQFYFSGADAAEKRVMFTGSDVLIEQMEQYHAEIPFQTVIKRIDKYYTLT
jgi:hypothetical protein